MAGEEVRGGVRHRITFTVDASKVFDVIAEATDRDAAISALGNRMASLLMSDQSLLERISLDAVWGIRDIDRAPAAAQGAEGVLREVAAERRRQVEVHGYDAAHDDQHTDGEIIWQEGWGAQTVLQEAMEKISHTRGQRRALLKAAAMIVAEIERLDRSALAGAGEREGA